jgi:hypothetical protein
MNKSASQHDAFTAVSQENISQRARELWEQYGRPEGRDTEIWLEAERQLLGVDSKVEGAGNVSVAAEDFDDATSNEKPRTRIGKSTQTRKPAAPAEEPAKTPAKSKAAAKTDTDASKPALARTGGSATLSKPVANVRPKR